MDFAHARTSVARRGMRVPSVGPVPPSVVHPDTAGSDVFERFEALSADAESDAFGATVQVTTQFDARAHDGTQRGARGPASYVDQSAPEKKGPLLELFLAYARRDDHRRRDAPLFFSRENVSGDDGVDAVDADENGASVGGGSLLSRAEVFAMMRDFGVVPSVVTERDVRLAFAHGDAPAAGDAAAANKEDELDFHEFCRFLANVATLSSFSPFSGSEDARMTKESAAEEAALRLLRRLECDSRDTRRLRAKVDEAFRLADRNPRASKTKTREDARFDNETPYARASFSATRANRRDGGSHAETLKASVVSMKGVSLEEARTGQSPSHRRFARVFDVLTRRESLPRDAPAWTEFPAPAVDCGTLFPGETRRFRVRVANKNPRASVTVAVRTEGVPCVEARFRESEVLAPGLTTTVTLVAGADAPGEWLGAVVVNAEFSGPARDPRARAPPRSAETGKDASSRALFSRTTLERVVVPVYLNVVHRDREIVARGGETVGLRGFVRTEGAAGVAETERAARFGFAAPRAPRGGDAAERLVMRDAAFVSKKKQVLALRQSGEETMIGAFETLPPDARVAASLAVSRARVAAAAENEAAVSARDRGWWGEKSEARVFHEHRNMRETVLDGLKARDETNERFFGGKAETAYRLSARGLRY